MGRPDDPSPGIGLGLAKVKLFADLHAGRAWAEPRDLGGLGVHVTLRRHALQHEN